MAVSPKSELTVVPFRSTTPPQAEDTQQLLDYLVREVQRLQATVASLVQAAPQATDAAPRNPLNGMIRYAEGAWATTLGGTGLYVYLGGTWTPINSQTGTWTPALTFGGGATGMTTSRNEGTWTRVGDLIWCQLDIILTAKGSSTGQAIVGGLPFTVGGTINIGGSVFTQNTGMTADLNLAIPSGGTTNLVLTKNTGLAFASLLDTDFSNTSRVKATFVYSTVSAF